MAGLEDLLPFEPRVYWRLFALENEAVWPAQPLLLAAGALLAFCLLRGWRPSARWLGPALAAAWLWAGWQFVALRYGTVNWVAPALAWGFYAEAALLAALGLSGRLLFAGRGRRAQAAIGLLAAALLAWPFLARLDGRTWREAEVFAVAPDPTAAATLALLALAGRSRWMALLCVVPALWLAVSALTLIHDGGLAGLGGACGPARRPRGLRRTLAKTCRRPVNCIRACLRRGMQTLLSPDRFQTIRHSERFAVWTADRHERAARGMCRACEPALASAPSGRAWRRSVECKITKPSSRQD